MYQATERPLDTTLSVSGMAADARTVGEILFNNKIPVQLNQHNLVVGVVNPSTGVFGASSQRISTNGYIPCIPGKRLIIDVASGYKTGISYYSANNEGSFLSGTTALLATNKDRFIINEEYFRIAIGRTDDSVVDTDDIAELSSAVNIYYVNQAFNESNLVDASYCIKEETLKSFIIEDYPGDGFVSLKMTKANAAASTVRVSNRNLIPGALVFYNNNGGDFTGTDSSATTRVRTSSFRIPYGILKFTLSNVPSGISLAQIRAFSDSATRLADATSFQTPETGAYTFSVPSDANYIHFLFKKPDEGVFDKTAFDGHQLMLECGDEVHPYIAGVQADVDGIFDTALYQMKEYIVDAAHTVIYASFGHIDFTITRRRPYLENQISHKSSKYWRDIDLSAFSGYEWFTTGDTFDNFDSDTTSAEYFNALNALSTAHPGYITATNLGKDASGTYDVYQYNLAAQTISCPYSGPNPPKILITGTQHGYEKGAAFSLYYLVKLLAEEWHTSPILEFLRDCSIVIIPMVNPWGVNNAVIGTESGYTNSNGVNLNRNYDQNHEPSPSNGAAPFSEIEAQYVRNMILANLDAMFCVDVHNNGSTRTSADYKIQNWLGVPVNGDVIVEKAHLWHAKNISRNGCREWSLPYTPLSFITYQTMGGMLSGYIDKCGIPAALFEGSHKFPYTELGEFSPSTNKFNLVAFVNWLGAMLSTYKTVYGAIK